MDRSHRPQLVAFTGVAGTGKSTIAKSMFPDYVKVSFADPIREMLTAAGLVNHLTMQKKEEPIEWLGRSPRYLMQTLGTEWGRELVSPDIWITLCQRRIQASLARKCWVVVDDCRFNNEARMIHRLGGVIVHLSREGVKLVATHSSEEGIERRYIDRVVYCPAEWSEKTFIEHVNELLYSFGGLPPAE